MTLLDRLTAAIRRDPGAKPRDDQLDLFGVTHPGKVRRDNQDQFLIATVHQQVVVQLTSLPDPERLPLRGERMGTMLLVADGVGRAKGGREASRLASSEQLCRALLDLALERGGSDNITVLAARARKSAGA
jgi:serine/threonine protein phosphatase PrpC